MKVKPRNAKVSGFPSPRSLRSFAAKRPNSIKRVLSGWSDSAKFPEPVMHRIKEATCVALMLEADNQIVGISHDDHVAPGLLPSPALSPEVEAVMQGDIG